MNAQAISHIPHSPSRTVRITRLRDEHDRFPGILEGSVFQRLHENAFVIHNDDSRDLVAAYALWAIIDQDGRLYTHEYMVDIYAALMPTSVILAGKASSFRLMGGFSPTSTAIREGRSTRRRSIMWILGLRRQPRFHWRSMR